MMKQTKKAFTLVELLIVITILAVLGAIGFMSYQSYTSDARNTTRISDIGQLEVAFSTKISKNPLILNDGKNYILNTTGGTNGGTGANVLTGGLKADGITLTATTSLSTYNAGDINYDTLALGTKFHDPIYVVYSGGVATANKAPYKLAILYGNSSTMYELAASLEPSDDKTEAYTYIKGTYNYGGTGSTTSNSPSLIKGYASTGAIFSGSTGSLLPYRVQ